MNIFPESDPITRIHTSRLPCKTHPLHAASPPSPSSKTVGTRETQRRRRREADHAIIPFKLSCIIGRASIHTRKAAARAFTALAENGDDEFKKPSLEMGEKREGGKEGRGKKRSGKDTATVFALPTWNDFSIHYLYLFRLSISFLPVVSAFFIFLFLFVFETVAIFSPSSHHWRLCLLVFFRGSKVGTSFWVTWKVKIFPSSFALRELLNSAIQSLSREETTWNIILDEMFEMLHKNLIYEQTSSTKIDAKRLEIYPLIIARRGPFNPFRIKE